MTSGRWKTLEEVLGASTCSSFLRNLLSKHSSLLCIHSNNKQQCACVYELQWWEMQGVGHFKLMMAMANTDICRHEIVYEGLSTWPWGWGALSINSWLKSQATEENRHSLTQSTPTSTYTQTFLLHSDIHKQTSQGGNHHCESVFTHEWRKTASEEKSK